MLIKEFIKDKSTLKYLLFLVLFGTILFFIIEYKNDVNKVENYLTTKHLEIVGGKEIYEQIKDVKNIKEIITEIRTDTCNIIKNKNLKNNEIIIPKYMAKNKTINDPFTIIINSQEHNFFIKEIEKDNNKYNCIVSEEEYSKLANETNNFKYLIALKDWAKESKTTTALYIATDNKAVISSASGRIEEKDAKLMQEYRNRRYDSAFHELAAIVLKVVLPTLVILELLLTLFITSKVIAEDEMYNQLYISLGYSKTYIIVTNIIKIVLLIGISLLISVSLAKLIFHLLIT